MGQRAKASVVLGVNRSTWGHVMVAARALFPEHNDYGVFAFGIGPRVAAGRARKGETTLNVYVLRKHARPARAVPPMEIAVGEGRFTLVPNVVATGRRPRARNGDAAPFTGLYAGACIRADGDPAGYGGVGCFVAPAGAADPTHFVTAGHLFPSGAAGATVTAGDGTSAPLVVGTLDVNLLDTAGIDAAAIRLNADGLALARSSADGPPLTEVLAGVSCFNKPVRAFRPTTHDYGTATTTTAGPTDAFLEAEPRGDYWVRGVVATQGAMTDEGDSGTVLCTGNHNELAVALCVGDYHAQSVCEPIARVLRTLAASIPNVALFPLST